MREELKEVYESLEKLSIPPRKISTIQFNVNFIDGAFLEIKDSQPGDYLVKIKDKDTGVVVYEKVIQNNHWVKTNTKYYRDWNIEVFNNENNQLIFSHDYNAKGRRVYIHLDSKSIGDTIAWFPYVEEFRKKHKCEVIVSTFHNGWFSPIYKELKFASPGETVKDIYAMYKIGWYYKEDNSVNYEMNVSDFKLYPLQKTASDILGLEYKEIKPKIHYKLKPKGSQKKYVAIGPHASAQAKYWNYPGGWQTIINYLVGKGYEVINISQEKLGDSWHDSKIGSQLYNLYDETGNIPIQTRLSQLKHADLFIGVGSGLSWLSWVVDTKTILISGFSSPETEFQDCERISTPSGYCKNCFNQFKLDPGDWKWCPRYKDTNKMFECTKSITPEMVIESINKLLNIE